MSDVCVQVKYIQRVLRNPQHPHPLMTFGLNEDVPILQLLMDSTQVDNAELKSSTLGGFQKLVLDQVLDSQYAGISSKAVYGMALQIWSMALNEQLLESEMSSRNPNSNEYMRVHHELADRFRHTIMKMLDDNTLNDIKNNTKKWNHGVLASRLVTDCIAYFSKRITGMECPESNWCNAVNAIIGNKHARHCRHARTCTFYAGMAAVTEAGSADNGSACT